MVGAYPMNKPTEVCDGEHMSEEQNQLEVSPCQATFGCLVAGHQGAYTIGAAATVRGWE